MANLYRCRLCVKDGKHKCAITGQLSLSFKRGDMPYTCVFGKNTISYIKKYKNHNCKFKDKDIKKSLVKL